MAALLFATAVFMFTIALWPKPTTTALPHFVEDTSTPRTLH